MKCLIVGLVVVILVTVSVCYASEKLRFDNYHVYQINPKTREQLAVVKQLESAPNSYIFLDGIHHLNSKINVVVAPKKVPKFVKSLARNFIPYSLVDTNVQAALDNDDEVIADSNRRTSDYTWDTYHELNDTYNWLYSLENKYTEVSVFVAGRSYEGREILGIKISYGPNKTGIFLEGGMHAREWISPATTTFIANQLLTGQDKEVRMIAENFDWYIVPHANPDGYVYTHTTNRFWRKTRTPYGNCYGADPNRNWGFHWNEVGSSNNPCSDTYAGPQPFSEVETKTLSDFIGSELKDNIFLYVSFHSYSQLLLFPYGHTSELPPNYKDLKRVYDAAVNAISKRYGTKYTGGNIYDAIYPASGASVDHVYGSFKINYSFCYELRPRQSAVLGFRLPANQIIPTGEETLDSLVAMIKEAGITQFL